MGEGLMVASLGAGQRFGLYGIGYSDPRKRRGSLRRRVRGRDGSEGAGSCDAGWRFGGNRPVGGIGGLHCGPRMGNALPC